MTVYEDISRFVPPPRSEDLSIWRYMDFTKYVALLETRSLFFPRVANLEDPFEGSFPPKQTVDSRLRGAFPPGVVPVDSVIDHQPGLEDMWNIMRHWAAVSCWHVSEHESAAMWRLYGQTTAAIAIRSRVHKLRVGLAAPPLPSGFGGSEVIHVGMVEYIDYSKDRIPDGSFAAQFFRKRRSFEHERELRALVLQFPRSENGQSVDFGQRPADGGLSVPVVDLNTLVEGVRVAPQAPRWYAELVSRVSVRYGIAVTPAQSELDETPVY